MKTKLYTCAFIVLMYIFPIRYALMESTRSNELNLLCMILSILGSLVFMALVFIDGKKGESAETSDKEIEHEAEIPSA